ncbi:MAG: S-layer homology domain-containing protein [Oscillospiraceae bacterium]|jgi:hypothetical protein|nr:S-layer homology domain-containing protein [Oscillospiraceae bacterium]
MKKLVRSAALLVSIAAAVSFIFAAAPVASAATSANDFSYSVSNKEVTITDYNGKGTSVVVPGTISGYPVVGVSFWYEGLTSIDVSACRELTYLGCGDNKLTYLDVSRNTKLERLICYNNSISSLELSKNSELYYLDCSNNALSYLNLSWNRELIDIYCSENRLTALDLSSLTHIDTLDCANNSISELELPQSVYHLNCSYNQLKTFTIEPGQSVCYLNCTNNGMTSLDVKNAEYLYGLDCSNNSLTRLDVYKNTGLQSLSCAGNQLSELNIRANTDLRALYCSDNRLTALNLSNNALLFELVCSWNYLTALDLSANTEIYAVDCSNNYIEKSNLKGIAEDKLDTEGDDENSYYGYYSYIFSPQASGTPWIPPFLDVSRKAWYIDDIRYAFEHKLFAGTSATTFSPEDAMTRGMLVTVLWGFAGRPGSAAALTFTDVAADAYYAPAVIWAREQGIVYGTSDTTFSPDMPITREQLTTILYKYAVKLGKADASGLPALEFFDESSISAYAQDSVRWCVKAKIISGFPDGTFGPQQSATRAQVARMLHAFADAVQ